MTGPVCVGTIVVPRWPLIPSRTFLAVWSKKFSVPYGGYGSGTRAGVYAPGGHMNRPPLEGMWLANLRLRNVVCTHVSLRTSGSECSNGPEKLPLRQSVLDAPWKPSKTEPIWKLRFMSTPQLLRWAGSVLFAGNLTVSSQ